MQAYLEELIDAIIQDNDKEVEHLLKIGADPNGYLDDDKISPLHFAVLYNAINAARLLLLAGSDLYAKTLEGETPISIAFRRGNPAMVDLLVSYQSYIH